MNRTHITIEANSIYEVLISLFRIANHDQTEQNYFENSGYVSHPRISEILNAIQDNLPHFFKQEVAYFFSTPIHFTSILWHLVCSKKITNIHDLVTSLSETKENDIIRCMLEEVTEQINPIDSANACTMEKCNNPILNDMNAFQKSVQEAYSLTDNDKERVLELCRYPTDAIQRFIRLLERYGQILEPFLPELDALNQVEVKKSQALYDQNEKLFFSDYLKINEKLIVPGSIVTLVPSCFSEIITYFTQPCKKQYILVYGCFISKKRIREEASEERKLFFKVLSEEKRIDIIKLLALKPAIGSDLAKQVGLTAATASYHLSMLQGIGIVEYQRIGQRLHYTLNQKTLKDLFSKAYNDLTHQHNE